MISTDLTKALKPLHLFNYGIVLLMFISLITGCNEEREQKTCDLELCKSIAAKYEGHPAHIQDAGYEHCLPIASLYPINVERQCRGKAIVIACGEDDVRINGASLLGGYSPFFVAPDGSCWGGGDNHPKDFKEPSDYNTCPGLYNSVTCERRDMLDAYEKMNPSSK